jgi:hypothetical protein
MPRLSAVGISGLQAGEDVKHVCVATAVSNVSIGFDPTG